MTAQELKDYILAQLAVPVNQVIKVINSLFAIVDFTTTQVSTIIPDWTAALTFNTDGSGDGKYCKHPDTNGKKRIFETKTDGNINNAPPTNPAVTENTHWKEVSSSSSAAIPEWSAGLYGPGLIIVYHNHSVDGRGLYVLLDPVRPYNSTNIETEITAGDWEPIASGGSSGGVVIAGTYADIAALLADQANQEEGQWYMVDDASADPTVDSGWAIYEKLAATTGVIGDYIKRAEQESLDVTFPDANETTKGKAEISTQAEAEDAASNGTIGSIDHTRIISGRGWRWAWEKAKTAAQTFTNRLVAKHFAFTWQTLTDAATIAWDGDNGNFASVTLAGNRTLGAITNPLSGGLYILRVIQDGTGGRTLAFNAQYTFPGSVTPVLNTAAGAATVLTFFFDGTGMRYTSASGDYKLANLYLTAIAASAGKKRPIYIDDTGKILRQTWVELDTTNQKTTVTGVDDLMATVLQEWKNSSGTAIMQILNGLRIILGGTSSVIEVTTGISSDNASLKVNDNQAKAYKFVDKTGNEFAVIKSTTGDLSFVIRQKREFNMGAGFTKVEYQTFVTTDTTAAAWTNIFRQVLTSDTAIEVCVNHLYAYATDRSVAYAYGNKDGYARRDNANSVSGTEPAYTITGDGITGVNWRIIANNTDKSLDIDFQNNSGSGKTWHVALDFSYVIRSLPS